MSAWALASPPARKACRCASLPLPPWSCELVEAIDERRLQRLQKSLAIQDLLIIDELGFVPLIKTGAELLYEIISQRHERGSIIITSNLPCDE
ncbi:IstB-like ATP binding protein [Paracoccus halophilus]|uniref:IstB-like ATP binding protein n=1 Tax=Paracoccus halophilus TaxID=376733 RepID=A0A1I0U3P3_9RHOB|nr:IstB-like ATP binding protein [Paracoccus halophilus]